MLRVLAAGLVLGVLSRIEETVDGLSAGVSSDGAWLGAAAVAGVLAASPRRGALAGALALTAANLGYYAWIATAEPGTPLAAVAGPPARWFALGLAGGAVFGAAGGAWRTGPPPVRIAAALLLAGVLVADGITAVRGGSPAAGLGIAAGAAVALLSARGAGQRIVAAAGLLAITAVAATGELERFLP
jgi:hypothetical protein